MVFVTKNAVFMYVNKLPGLCYSDVVDNEVKHRCPFSRKNVIPIAN